MGRKSNAEIKREKSVKFGAFLTIILSFAFAIVSVMKESGIVGSVTYNLFTFLFGKFYIVLLITAVIISIAKLLKHKFTALFSIGLVLFNISIILLCGFVCRNSVESFSAYRSFFFDSILSRIFSIERADFGAGLAGHTLYLLCVLAFDKKLTIAIIIIGIVLSVLMMIPLDWYKNLFEESKKQRAAIKEERRKAKEERKKREEEEALEEKRREEERCLKLAEEINSLNDYEELKDNTEKEVVEKPQLDMSSNSEYFLNIGISKHPVKVQEKEEKEEEIEILTEAPKIRARQHKVIARNGQYRLPPMSLLEPKTVSKQSQINKANAIEKGKRVIEILKTFDIDATLVNTYIGPSVTKFEIKPDSTIKVNRISSIQDNIKMELAAKDIRIEAPIPGKNAIGIEIPNAVTTPVKMSELIPGIEKNEANMKFALGKNLLGENIYCDIRKAPHLLIAGATGSGKSVCENAIITSILLRSHPDNVKLVLIDPKKVEFMPYQDIPHLLWPVITDAKLATLLLEKLVVIMEKRYDQFSKAGAKNLDAYNEYVLKHNENLKADEIPLEPMSYIVVIIDELADLMATSKNEVIGSIQRITQLARASGIHLIVATQRPSADIITGVIKNNIPSRIAFSMPTSIDSRTIIDQVGAERLLGNGDMLYAPQNEPAPIRLQGVYVTDNEISKITTFVKAQASPNYDDTYDEIMRNNSGDNSNGSGIMNSAEVDPLYDEIIDYIRTSQKASTSLLQRRFGIGFNRAARIIDQLEEKHIVGPANGSKPREVLLKPEDE